MSIERRVISGGSLRASSEGKDRIIGGYAAVFNSLSEPIGGPGAFREKIHRSAFDKCLKSKADVRCLWNHDASHVLGRTKSGTLTLRTDDTGLSYSCTLPDTQTGRDLFESVKRGDVTGSSFGFLCHDDVWDDDESIRELREVELFDAGPVTFPAYPQSTVQVRAANGQMETIDLGVYRSARSRQLPPPPAVVAAEKLKAMRQRSRSLLGELGLRSTNDDDAECQCLCESCKNDDCENCDCGGCDSLGCQNDSCQNDSCQCDGHRGVRRQRHSVGRTITPPGTGIEAWERQQQEQKLFWARLCMKAASAR